MLRSSLKSIGGKGGGWEMLGGELKDLGGKGGGNLAPEGISI